MIRFAALCFSLPDPAALARYEAEAPMADLAAAHRLLSGQRPRRIATLDQILDWSASVAGIPDFLVTACMEASGDRAETAALLLPPALGQAPMLAETLHLLALSTPLTARQTLGTLWSRLPPQANHILNRLAAGTFRSAGPKPQPDIKATPQSIRAVMTLVQPSGPEITLALWDDGKPVPIARLPLTLPETPAIMAWVRANTVERFGPVRSVAATLVFDLAFDGIAENRRRKSGVELRNPRIMAWRHDAPAETLQSLTARLNAPLTAPLTES